jgi:tetratricopeptide (TPR) repeat protein
MLAAANMDLGGSNRATENYDKLAIQIWNSIKTAESINYFTVLSVAYGQLGQLSEKKGYTDSALAFYQQALDYSNRSGYKKYWGFTLTLTGNIYQLFLMCSQKLHHKT